MSEDGKRAVTGSYDETARIWDADSGLELFVLKGHTNWVQAVTFSGNAKRVLTWSNKTARLWDAESGKQIGVLRDDLAAPATFSADSARMITASLDGTARIWDAESGKEIAILDDYTKQLTRASLSADATRAVISSTDYKTSIWDVSWATTMRGETLRERVCGEKLLGAAQEFTENEMEDPILRGIDKNDRIARNPCLRRGPLSLDYWTRVPGELWRFTRALAGQQ